MSKPEQLPSRLKRQALLTAVAAAATLGGCWWLVAADSNRREAIREAARRTLADPQRVAHTQEAGSRVCDALQLYQADRGTYPKTLQDLVPKYLTAIEPPTAGVPEWSYTTTGVWYELRFGMPSFELPSHYNTGTGWQTDFDS